MFGGLNENMKRIYKNTYILGLYSDFIEQVPMVLNKFYTACIINKCD